MATWLFQHDFVQCHLQIQHRTRLRNKLSKQPIKPPLRPYEEVDKYFKQVQGAWHADPACLELKAMLNRTLPRSDKIYAFALGHMTRPLGEAMGDGPAYQHALLPTLRDLLG